MSVCLFSLMRDDSERLPHKMRQCIFTSNGVRTLGEAMLDNLVLWSNVLGVDYKVGITPIDWDTPSHPFLSQRYYTQVREAHIIERDEESLRGETGDTIYNENLRNHFTGYDWAVHVNACCPFLTTESLHKFLQALDFPEPRLPMTTVYEKRGFVLDHALRPIRGLKPTGLGNTKADTKYHVPCHAFHAYPNPVNTLGFAPRRFVPVQHGTEFMDIDTEEDYQLAWTWSVELHSDRRNRSPDAWGQGSSHSLSGKTAVRPV